jgi:predicted transporter
LFSVQSVFAQKQNIESENNNLTSDLLLLVGILFFTSCFIILYLLKLKEGSRKHAQYSNSNKMNPLHAHQLKRRHHQA